MKLVIVESPTKAKTIAKFLGKGYKVESSYGHVRDLPKSKLGVDVEKNFEPQYVIPTKSRKNVTALKKIAKKSDVIILATDEDREGEAIAWHLVHALDIGEKDVKRIVFHEITKGAIEEALQSPRPLDENMVSAQQARRVLDRLVGYKLSPFLWKKIARGLSAGRVQSVALRLIVEREEEVKKFVPQEYWTIGALLEKSGESFEANVIKIGGETLEKFAIPHEARAKEIAGELERETYAVAGVEQKELMKHPSPPFTTSTLQQTAARRFGFSSKKTMFLAQRLYENGLITYMRTDSVNLSKESTVAAKAWLDKELGAEYASAAPRQFKAKSRLAQEAHEAIRPTDVKSEPNALSVEDAAEKKLYTLIWQRFVASQMPAARVVSTSIDITAGKYGLRVSGQRVLFDGFTKIWPQQLSEKNLPALREGDACEMREIKPEQHFTEPLPRYSEAMLIKALEEHGIGRPSTYAPTISVIQVRNYVTKEKGRFVPTETGELVNKVLIEHFPKIVDIGFTAKMEDELDEIAEGKEQWQKVIGAFYGPFEKNLAEKYEEVSKTAVVEEKTDQVCEKCGKPMVVKFGRFGKFIACSGFPDCKNTKQLPKEAPKSLGIPCPKCGKGEIVERRVHKGRARGRRFWGCNKYPDCDFATWEDPTKASEGEAKEKTAN